MRRDEPPSGSNPPRLTGEAVRQVRFRKPPFGKRGYDEQEVNAFLEVLAEALSARGATRVTSLDVHNVSFRKPPLGKRGYDEDDVDMFLDAAEGELRARESGSRPALPAARRVPPRPAEPGAIVHAIWQRTQARDWHGVADLIDPAFVCEWPESRERFMGREAWITMNVNYPSDWNITVDMIVAQGDTAVSRVRVTDENGTFHASSFWTIRDGRAARLTEYYVREGSATPAEWRTQWSQRY